MENIRIPSDGRFAIVKLGARSDHGSTEKLTSLSVTIQQPEKKTDKPATATKEPQTYLAATGNPAEFAIVPQNGSSVKSFTVVCASAGIGKTVVPDLLLSVSVVSPTGFQPVDYPYGVKPAPPAHGHGAVATSLVVESVSIVDADPPADAGALSVVLTF